MKIKIEKYENGNPKIVSNMYDENTKEGLEFVYNANKSLKEVNNYMVREVINDGLSVVSSNKEGENYTFYTNKGLKEEIIYKAGKKDGLYVKYYPVDIHYYPTKENYLEMLGLDYIVKSEVMYSKGLKDGKYTEYDIHGKVSVLAEYENDIEIGMRTEFKNEIKIKETLFRDNFKTVTRYIDNKIVSIHNYNKDNELNGEIRYYDNDNNLNTITHYINGVRTGGHQEFYPNGTIKCTGSYTGNKEKSLANGIFTWFYENGSKKWEVPYVNGKEDGEVIGYDENSEESYRHSWKKGRLN